MNCDSGGLIERKSRNIDHLGERFQSLIIFSVFRDLICCLTIGIHNIEAKENINDVKSRTFLSNLICKYFEVDKINRLCQKHRKKSRKDGFSGSIFPSRYKPHMSM